MKPLGKRSRWAVYGVALVATLLAVRWAGGQDEPVARPERGASAAPSPAPSRAAPERPASRQAASASRP